jgi:ubiquinone/menaquinone biosynthesis C-methylase UbiE
MTVMDLGCGAGFASLGLAKLVGDGGLVISVDVQPEMLEMVRSRAAKVGLSNTIRTHLCEHDCIGLH